MLTVLSVSWCFSKVVDRESQIDNPCPGWISALAWDNLTELDKLTNFHDIITSFEQYSRDWHQWYTSTMPETECLPGLDQPTTYFVSPLISYSGGHLVFAPTNPLFC